MAKISGNLTDKEKKELLVSIGYPPEYAVIALGDSYGDIIQVLPDGAERKKPPSYMPGLIEVS